MRWFELNVLATTKLLKISNLYNFYSYLST